VSIREVQQRIRDILAAIAEIQKFTRGMDYETFCADDRTIRAVEMNFIIIGESANHISEDFEESNSDVPWNLMSAMRNRVVHVYFSIDAKLLWETIQNDLPPLIPKLEKLL
jgi:uncharacterized protein with HEPN domain